MPRGVKSAPPQQASLNELWGKKKVKKDDATVKMEDTPKKEEDAMDVDLNPHNARKYADAGRPPKSLLISNSDTILLQAQHGSLFKSRSAQCSTSRNIDVCKSRKAENSGLGRWARPKRR